MFFIAVLNNLINTGVSAYHAVPSEVWPLIAASGVLSGFQLKVHDWFSVQSPKVKQFITLVISGLAAGIPAALGWLSSNPTVIGANTALVFSGMTLLYRFVVKGTAENLSEFKDFKVNKDLNKDTQIIVPVAQSMTKAEQNTNDLLG